MFSCYSPWSSWSRKVWQILWYVVFGCHHVYSVSESAPCPVFQTVPLIFIWILIWGPMNWGATLSIFMFLYLWISQALWLPTFLFQSRPGHITWDEEEDPHGTVRVSQSWMVRSLRRRYAFSCYSQVVKSLNTPPVLSILIPCPN